MELWLIRLFGLHKILSLIHRRNSIEEAVISFESKNCLMLSQMDMSIHKTTTAKAKKGTFVLGGK